MVTYVFNIDRFISVATELFYDVRGEGLKGIALFKRYHVEPISILTGLRYADGSRVAPNEPLKTQDILRGDILIATGGEVYLGVVNNIPFYPITPIDVICTRLRELLNIEHNSAIKGKVLETLGIPKFQHITEHMLSDIPMHKTNEEVDNFLYGLDAFYRTVVKPEVNVKDNILYDVEYHGGSLMVIERYDVYREYAKNTLEVT